MPGTVRAGSSALHDEAHWDQKYRFFSQPKMRSYYGTFAKARHDPFNKDPTWGRSIMQKLGDACNHRGCEPKDMFYKTSDGKLDRAQLQNVIHGVLPSLSDMELTSIFNSSVEASSGKVDAEQFCAKLSKACAEPKISDEISQRWKNPLYRIQRFAPCELELEGHLEEISRGHKSEPKRANSVRPCGKLNKIPRHELPETTSSDSTAYEYFNGGFDNNRFRRHEWMQARSTGFSASPRHRALKPIEGIPDPGGPDVRPGWHVSLTAGSLLSSKMPLSAR
eukprot:TRINITY_DN97485_c0_g1_i1.p1 TRINITY_DN97485_c0_g1~~TRINITY_DN97485_c0_g1_i1.p1  ORF type:complete len:279 (+),score=27.22 TRINITY_DN97485_c0_g1_i1:51-887(+)